MCQTSVGARLSRAVRRQQSPKEGPTVIKIRSEEGDRAKAAVFTRHLERSQTCTTIAPHLLPAAVSEERGSRLLAEMCLLPQG